MASSKKAVQDEDGTAPLTRSQRAAILSTPALVIMSAIHVWDGLNGPAELPGMVWVSLAVATLIGSTYSFAWYSAGEKRDEREVLIELKSIRVGALVLIAGNILVLPFAASQLHDAIGALLFFSWAVTSASILFYSRRSA